MKNYLRGLDGKTVAAFALLLVVLMSCWQLVQQQEDGRAKDKRIDTLISLTRDKDAAALIEHRIAARERRTNAANQAALLDYTKALAARQGALLAYLDRHGIVIPPRYVTPVNPPVLRDPSSPAPDGRPPNSDQKQQGGDSRPPRGSGGSTGDGNPPGRPPRNNGPGNSENAPGHNKPKKHRGQHGRSHKRSQP